MLYTTLFYSLFSGECFTEYYDASLSLHEVKSVAGHLFHRPDVDGVKVSFEGEVYLQLVKNELGFCVTRKTTESVYKG